MVTLHLARSLFFDDECISLIRDLFPQKSGESANLENGIPKSRGHDFENLLGVQSCAGSPIPFNQD